MASEVLVVSLSLSVTSSGRTTRVRTIIHRCVAIFCQRSWAFSPTCIFLSRGHLSLDDKSCEIRQRMPHMQLSEVCYFRVQDNNRI